MKESCYYIAVRREKEGEAERGRGREGGGEREGQGREGEIGGEIGGVRGTVRVGLKMAMEDALADSAGLCRISSLTCCVCVAQTDLDHPFFHYTYVTSHTHMSHHIHICHITYTYVTSSYTYVTK